MSQFRAIVCRFIWFSVLWLIIIIILLKTGTKAFSIASFNGYAFLLPPPSSSFGLFHVYCSHNSQHIHITTTKEKLHILSKLLRSKFILEMRVTIFPISFFIQSRGLRAQFSLSRPFIRKRSLTICKERTVFYWIPECGILHYTTTVKCNIPCVKHFTSYAFINQKHDSNQIIQSMIDQLFLVWHFAFSYQPTLRLSSTFCEALYSNEHAHTPPTKPANTVGTLWKLLNRSFIHSHSSTVEMMEYLYYGHYYGCMYVYT